MSSINPSVKDTLAISKTRSGIPAGWATAVGRAWSSLQHARRGEAPDWSALNDHLLQDIAETRSGAEREALRSPLKAPLGSIGFRSEPWLAFRSSPLR